MEAEIQDIGRDDRPHGRQQRKQQPARPDVLKAGDQRRRDQASEHPGMFPRRLLDHVLDQQRDKVAVEDRGDGQQGSDAGQHWIKHREEVAERRGGDHAGACRDDHEGQRAQADHQAIAARQ